MIFVDSNIIIDLVEDGDWTDWSRRTLGSQGGGARVTNLVVFGEVSRPFRSAQAVQIFLRELAIDILELTPEVAFRAGLVHVHYRLTGGEHRAILADFLIGAHAELLGATLITRDRGRFSTYFPDLTLLTPETDHD